MAGLLGHHREEEDCAPGQPVVQVTREELRNAVRYVLVNDLGLTREYVRTVAKGLIEEAVRRRVNSLAQRGEVDRVITGYLDNHKFMVQEGVESAATSWMCENLGLHDKKG